MCNAQGLNNGTVLRDDKNLRTWSSFPGSKLSTAVQGPFGGSSLLFVATSLDRWETSDSADFAFGTGDFTIEAWVYPTGAGAYRRILSQQTGGTNLWVFRQSNVNKLELIAITSSTTIVNLNSSTSLSASAWNFCSWTRSGNNHYGHLNGIMEASTSNASAMPDASQLVMLGCYFDGSLSEFWQGNIGPFRITKGVARYGSGNYTPPTGPFPAFGP